MGRKCRVGRKEMIALCSTMKIKLVSGTLESELHKLQAVQTNSRLGALRKTYREVHVGVFNY